MYSLCFHDDILEEECFIISNILYFAFPSPVSIHAQFSFLAITMM